MFKKRKLGSNHWDSVHEKLKAQKRDATSCPQSYSLCASSLGGGCCPTDRSCGPSSCYATATSTTTGCPPSQTTCGVVEGGGCCPFGYACQRNACISPTGSSVTAYCAANSYLCPSSLSYGCCRNGLVCGISTCYETTSITSVPITLTLTTTNSNSAPTTITTVVETAYNPASPTLGSTSPLPTPIAKLPAVTTSSLSTSLPSIINVPSSGMNAKELGGIVGACVFLLLVLLLATYLILRRLNLTIKLTKDHATTKHPRGSNSNSPNNLRNMSIGIDPLQQIPSTRTGTRSYHPRTNQTTPSELSDNTPLNGPGYRYQNNRSSRIPPLVSFSPLNWPAKTTPRSGNANGSSATTGAYRSLPTSDSSRHWRNDSEGSTQSISQPTTVSMNAFAAELQSPDPPQGYFDIPIPKTTAAMTADIDPAIRDQNLRFGHNVSLSQGSVRRPSIDETRSGHGRQWSDVSELSNGTETTNESYELDDTSPKSTYGHKYGSKSSGYGYGSGNHNDRKSLREGVKNKVQDWVGMTGLGRKTSRRKDEGLGLISGGLGGLKAIPSPTIGASSMSSSASNQDQEQWLHGMERPLASFAGRFGDKGRLEAIREALRESGTTVNTNPRSDTAAGEVSESRAQIARMELKRVDSDMSDMTDMTLMGREDVGSGDKKYKYLVA